MLCSSKYIYWTEQKHNDYKLHYFKRFSALKTYCGILGRMLQYFFPYNKIMINLVILLYDHSQSSWYIILGYDKIVLIMGLFLVFQGFPPKMIMIIINLVTVFPWSIYIIHDIWIWQKWWFLTVPINGCVSPKMPKISDPIIHSNHPYNWYTICFMI
mgnify:CR=1 FL=1